MNNVPKREWIKQNVPIGTVLRLFYDNAFKVYVVIDHDHKRDCKRVLARRVDTIEQQGTVTIAVDKLIKDLSSPILPPEPYWLKIA